MGRDAKSVASDELRNLFLSLWTAATKQESYTKDDWQRLRKLIEDEGGIIL